MKLYRALISFGAGLAAVFGSWYVCSLFVNPASDWFSALNKPTFTPNATIMMWIWISVHVMFIIAITVCVYKPELRKSLIIWGIILILNTACSIVLFKFELPLISVSALLLIIASLVFATNIYIKKTKELWLLMIPLLSWYVFLFILNYGIVIMN